MSRRFTWPLFAAFLILQFRVAWAEDEVVLVVAKDSPIAELSALDIRKTYLGVNVAVDGKSIKGYRLSNDQQLNQIFMQSVIAMSERSYERRLLSLTVKYGRPRPTEVDGPTELVDAIEDDLFGIGYMWKSDAEKAGQVRIVRVLWQSR
jgi:hypothetical protein